MKRKHRVLALLVPLIVLCKAVVAEGAGACCVDGIVCISGQTEEACGNVGGFFPGTGTTCAANGRCKGACCVSGDCREDLSQQECDGQNGVFQGGGTICESEDDLGDNLCAVVFVPHDVSVAADGASSVIAVDLDADGDTDLLSASAHDDTIAWYENLGGSPPSFAARVISTTAQGASSVFATDLDNDGDIDVLSASQDDDKIAWYESDGGSPPAFVTHIITGDRLMSATGLALAIPDDGFPASGVSHVLNVTESFLVVDVDIGMRVNHTFVGDLIIQVEHLGTTVTLVNQPGDATDVPGAPFGCDDENYDIVLDDEGTGGAIEDQCVPDLSSPPSYTPNGALSAFDGADSAGAWTITVYDTAGADIGTLDEWSIRLKGALNEAFGDGAASVSAADIDGDGDMDVLSAAPLADTRCSNDPSTRCTSIEDCCVDVSPADGQCDDPDNICSQTLAWYENDGNTPPGFTPRLIPGDQFGRDARFVVAADMDGDTDIDVVTTSGGGPGEGVCSRDAARACNVETDCAPGVCEPVQECDLDSPNPGEACTLNSQCTPGLCESSNECVDTDVPCQFDTDCPFDACILDHAIAWYENTGAADPDLRFTEHLIRSGLGTSVFSPSVMDIDDDGFKDIASAADGDVAIAWHENDGASPPIFAQHFVSSAALSTLSVFAADVDGDGDADIVSASSGRRCGGDTSTPGEFCVTAADCGGGGPTCDLESWVGWHENRGGSPPRFSARIRRITNNVDDARSVFSADVDGDGDMDIISASAGDDRIAWYENQSALEVLNVTTNRNFATIASAVANAADLQVISAHPDRFDDAEPTIDFRGKGLTLQARGDIVQPVGGEYTLADNAKLQSAPGAWDLTLRGTLITPPGAQAELSTTGAFTLGATGTLTAAGGAGLSVDVGAMLEGTTNVGPNATIAFAGDVTLEGAANVDIGGALTSSGALTATASSTLSVSGGEVFSVGDLTLAGATDLNIGSSIQTNGGLFALANSTLIAAGAEVSAAGDVTLDGLVSLDLGSTLTAGGTLLVSADNPLTTLTLGAGSGLFIAGDVSLDRPVVLDVDASIATNGALILKPDSNELTVGSNASISAEGNVTLQSPTSLAFGSALAAGGVLDNTSDLEFVGSGLSAGQRFSNRGAIVGFGTIEANVHNFHQALFRADTQVVGDYLNGTPLGLCDDSDPMFEDQECIDDSDCGGGAGACQKLGRCEDGIPCSADGDCTVDTCKRLGRCDDGTLTTEGQVCSVDVDCADTCGQGTCTGASVCSNNSERACVNDSDCKLCTADANVKCNDDADCGGSNGVCATALCDDASGALAGKACTTDLECGGGFCVQLGKCDGADPTIIPGQACTGDVQCGTGRCFSGTTIIEQDSMLVIIGTLSNFGTIIGNALTRPLLGHHGGNLQTEQAPSAGAAQQPAEQGFFVHGHFVTGATALLLMPLPQSVVRVGGNYTAATNASTRYDMAQAELRMVGVGGQAQELEVMSKDIGPTPHGLDRTRPGHYPIGMLRIGPPATTVDLVDSHDNDGLGQGTPEAIYAKTLVIESGATLRTNTHMVYYGTLVLSGQVDDPDNLVGIIPVPQDFDLDFDVDLDDYRTLYRCVEGPGSGNSGGACTAAQFDQADSDNDNDVDLLDIRKFQLAFTGD